VARLCIILSRWRSRSQQALLQHRAAHLGRAVTLRRAWAEVCAWRGQQLARAAKRLNADVHRWAVLLRTILRAWWGGYAARRAALARRADELALRAARLCRICWVGWAQYVRLSVAARRVLVGRALRLLRVCVGGWRTWLDARRAKWPAKAALRRRGRHSRLLLAFPEWIAASRSRIAEQARRRLAEAESRAAALAAALARWRAARGAAARGALWARRAHVFMAGRLLGCVYAAWCELPQTRRRLDAAVPRVAARLDVSRLRLRLHRWQGAIAATASWQLVLISCDGRARRLALSAGVAALRAPVLLLRRRERARDATARLARGGSLSRHLRGWVVACTRKRRGREATAATARALRRWRGAATAAARVADSSAVARSTAAWHSATNALCHWHWTAASYRLNGAMTSAAGRAHASSARRAAYLRWAACARFSAASAATAFTARVAELARVVAAWRARTASAEAGEAAWRRAVRHLYLGLLAHCLCGWRRYHARRLAQWSQSEAARAALGQLRRRRALLRWRAVAAAISSRDARARVHAQSHALGSALRDWTTGWAELRHLVSQRCAADACRYGALCARVVAGWARYVEMRAERREEVARQVAAHRAVLRRLARGRALRRWREGQGAALARASALGEAVRAMAQRRTAAALGVLQAHVVQTRVALGRRRIAMCTAAHVQARRALCGWRAYLSWRSLHLASRRRAERARALVLCHACWGGWERHHVRKQHKAALMASAAARHRRELRANTAAVWLEAGLASHAAKVERAAQRTATRAAASLRLAERYARRWLAVVAERAAARAAPSTGSGAQSGFGSPVAAAPAYQLNFHLTPCEDSPGLRGSATPVWPSGAFAYSPGGLAYSEGTGIRYSAATSRTPTRAAASAHTPAARDWEGLLPQTTRRAPRPLPKFDAADAVPLRLPFGAPSPPAAPASATPAQSWASSAPSSSLTAAERAPTSSAMTQRASAIPSPLRTSRRPSPTTPPLGYTPRAVPPPEPPEPLTELVNWQRVQGQLRSTPHALTSPPARLVATPPPSVTPAEEAATAPDCGLKGGGGGGGGVGGGRGGCGGGGGGGDGDGGGGVGGVDGGVDGASERDEAQVGREVREIETRLRGYAELKSRHAANAELRNRLVTQADGLPPSQRPALLEATRQLQAAIDEYASPAATAARQADVGRLALRIVQLQDLDGGGDATDAAGVAHPECHRVPTASCSCGQAW